MHCLGKFDNWKLVEIALPEINQIWQYFQISLAIPKLLLCMFSDMFGYTIVNWHSDDNHAGV